jgi:hypothetical protein
MIGAQPSASTVPLVLTFQKLLNQGMLGRRRPSLLQAVFTEIHQLLRSRH